MEGGSYIQASLIFRSLLMPVPAQLPCVGVSIFIVDAGEKGQTPHAKKIRRGY